MTRAYVPSFFFVFSHCIHECVPYICRTSDVSSLLGVALSIDVQVVGWNIHHLEWMQRQLYLLSRKHNRVARFVKIIDLEGLHLGMLHPTNVGLVRQLLHATQAFYPEVLSSALVLNAPSIVSYAYRLIKTVLSERTQRRVHITNGPPDKEFVTDCLAENLPEEYGGTKCCLFGCFPLMDQDDCQESVNVSRADRTETEWGNFVASLRSRHANDAAMAEAKRKASSWI